MTKKSSKLVRILAEICTFGALLAEICTFGALFVRITTHFALIGSVRCLCMGKTLKIINPVYQVHNVC